MTEPDVTRIERAVCETMLKAFDASDWIAYKYNQTKNRTRLGRKFRNL